MLMRLWAPVVAALVLIPATACLSAPPENSSDDQNVFVLGGPFQHEWVWETALLWRNHYESNFFAGVGYQNFLYHTGWGLRAGLEAGIGIRAGRVTSAEVWAGVVARYDGLNLGDLNISPAVTAGVSLASNSIGVESERAAALGRGVPVLFYLGPELAISHVDNPNTELIVRIHHRSGGYAIIAPIDGSNAATVGIRFNF